MKKLFCSVIVFIITLSLFAATAPQLYQDGQENKTEDYLGYVIGFNENGQLIAEGNGENFWGSWLSFRNDGLFLGLNFDEKLPMDILNHRWKISDISPNRIELKNFNANGEIERILVLEKK